MIERVGFGGVSVVGFGESDVVAPAAAGTSPWVVALATSAAATATGWVLEEVRDRIRGKKRQR